MSITSWPQSATSRNSKLLLGLFIAAALAEACVFLINPFLNYRAEGNCRTASAQISPNEPPAFLSPASLRLPVSMSHCTCVCLSSVVLSQCQPYFFGLKMLSRWLFRADRNTYVFHFICRRRGLDWVSGHIFFLSCVILRSDSFDESRGAQLVSPYIFM